MPRKPSPKPGGKDARIDTRAQSRGWDEILEHANVAEVVEWKNQAQFEDWLQRYGTWDNFLNAMRRKRREPDR